MKKELLRWDSNPRHTAYMTNALNYIPTSCSRATSLFLVTVLYLALINGDILPHNVPSSSSSPSPPPPPPSSSSSSSSSPIHSQQIFRNSPSRRWTELESPQSYRMVMRQLSTQNSSNRYRETYTCILYIHDCTTRCYTCMGLLQYWVNCCVGHEYFSKPLRLLGNLTLMQ